MHIQTSHWNWHGHCTLISNTPLNRSRFWHMIMKLTSTLHVDHKDSLKPVTFLRHTGIQISQWNWHRHCTLIINAPLDRSHFWHICAFKLGSEIDIEKCTLVTSTPLHRSLPSLVPVAGGCRFLKPWFCSWAGSPDMDPDAVTPCPRWGVACCCVRSSTWIPKFTQTLVGVYVSCIFPTSL